jgi:hypothetical protein
VGKAYAACDANCLKCEASGCTQCPSGYSPRGEKCSNCDGSCKTCSGPSSAECLSCFDAGVYLNGVCKSCDSTCQACTGTSSSQSRHARTAKWPSRTDPALVKTVSTGMVQSARTVTQAVMPALDSASAPAPPASTRTMRHAESAIAAAKLALDQVKLPALNAPKIGAPSHIASTIEIVAPDSR